MIISSDYYDKPFVFDPSRKDHKNLNKDLSKYIYDLRDEEKTGLTRSNKGGWHSKNFKLGFEGTIQHKFALEMQKYIIG